MNQITSKDNSVIKLYRKIVSSKSERHENGLYAIEGIRLCLDAWKSGVSFSHILIEEKLLQSDLMYDMIQTQGPSVFVINEYLSSYISDTNHPQGVFALVHIPEERNFTISNGHIMFLDDIQDPGNLGTIIRTAESFGIKGLVLTENCPDIYSPKVVRSTMGSCFRLPIFRTSDMVYFIKNLQKKDFQCYAATLTPDALQLPEINFPDFSGVVIGNEGNGISNEVIDCCDAKIYIPMKGSAESLNASVAASVFMWQMFQSELF